jgi:hypothetical protein
LVSYLIYWRAHDDDEEEEEEEEEGKRVNLEN